MNKWYRKKFSQKDRKYTFYVIDSNIGFDIAYQLGKRGNLVYYYILLNEAFPKMENVISGYGFDEIIKEEYLDLGKICESDCVVMTDCIEGKLVDFLREELEIPVFGSGSEGIKLENDRIHFLKTFPKYGLSVPESYVVNSLEEALDFLNEPVFKDRPFIVKINKHRGNIETFKFTSIEEFETMITQAGFGPFISNLQFIFQELCEGVELGFDGFFNGTKFIEPIFYTIEIKGEGTIGVWKTPNGLKEDLEKLTRLLSSLNYRGNFSCEFFWDGKTTKYIDVCARLPYPGSSLFGKMIRNFDEVVLKVAKGEDVVMDIIAPYGCEVGIYTDDELWKKLSFDEEYKDSISFRKVVKQNGDYYLVPGDNLVATINETGWNIIEAIDKALKIANSFSAYNIYFSGYLKQNFMERIEKIKSLGRGFEF